MNAGGNIQNIDFITLLMNAVHDKRPVFNNRDRITDSPRAQYTDMFADPIDYADKTHPHQQNNNILRQRNGITVNNTADNAAQYKVSNKINRCHL